MGFYVWKKSGASFTKDIGKVEVYKGKVILKEHSQAKTETIEKDRSFKSGSLLISSNDADVVLEFPDTRLRLKPDSQIFIEQVVPNIVIYLQKGGLEKETDIGDNSPVLIESGLQRQSVKKYFDSLATPAQRTAETNPDPTGLTQETIQNTLRRSQPLFFRCYTQLLQRSPKAKGQVDLVFTIQSSGKISQPQISGSQLRDDPFRRCLTDVVSRIEFPRFDGRSVSAVFPLKFE
ncbi:MAG: AgmX/PglI C-terminal domain-containing protein [Bdellovibrionota bacterium]